MQSFRSQVIVSDQFVLRRVFATGWFLTESVGTVGSQARACEQFVLRRVFETSWFSVVSVRTVRSQASV